MALDGRAQWHTRAGEAKHTRWQNWGRECLGAAWELSMACLNRAVPKLDTPQGASAASAGLWIHLNQAVSCSWDNHVRNYVSLNFLIKGGLDRKLQRKRKVECAKWQESKEPHTESDTRSEK